MSDRRIEYRPLRALSGQAKNPKAHAEADIAASVERFGYVETICMDDRTGLIVAGHGRRDHLLSTLEAGGDPPEGVRVEDGEWLVPVQVGWASRDDDEAAAYVVASNRISEKGGWIDVDLADVLSQLRTGPGLEGTGYDSADLDELLAELAAAEPKAALTDPDDVPPVPVEPVTKPGDLWLLGPHRLLCGDATSEADVERLRGGVSPTLLATDPPYGVGVDHTWRDHAGLNNTARLGSKVNRLAPGNANLVANDDRDDWTEAYRLAEAECFIIWHSGIHSHTVRATIEAAGYEVMQQVIWFKGSAPILGRSYYHWNHEPAWFGKRKGGSVPWLVGRDQITVWEAPPPNRLMVKQTDDKTEHPTQKPIVLWSKPIENHVAPEGWVYDPFGGSGSCLIAAHRLGRRALIMELEPMWCDVIARRYQEHTGTLPILEATGAEHDFTAQTVDA